jgi:hypothetical protein
MYGKDCCCLISGESVILIALLSRASPVMTMMFFLPTFGCAK